MKSSLRNRLSDVKVIIINEILMVSNDLLFHVHLRLTEIFGSVNDQPFAGDQRRIQDCCNIQHGLPAVNYYHKVLHLGCCSSPRSASGISYYSLPFFSVSTCRRKTSTFKLQALNIYCKFFEKTGIPKILPSLVATLVYRVRSSKQLAKSALIIAKKHIAQKNFQIIVF